MKKIFLSGRLGKGKSVIVDDEDYDKYGHLQWHLSSTGYAVRRGVFDGKKQTIRMHQLIAQPSKGLVVDHINRNRLDNRRANLRCVTQAENLRNSDRVENAKGYYYSNSKCRGNRHWVVEYMGVSNTFATEKEAIKAVEQLKNGTFIKRKKLVHETCQKCGSKKQWYGSYWRCRNCVLERCRKYYQRKKLREKNNG